MMQDHIPIKDLAGTRVLVVEDQPLEAMDYCDQLCDAGAEIIGPCASVRQALACLEKTDIDVAIVDYALADQTSESLQAALERRNIPFVLLTGYPRVLVRRAPDQTIISKPVSPDLLCRLIKAARSSSPA